MSMYTLYLEPNDLNGLYTVDSGRTQVKLSESQKERLLKLIKANANPTWVKGVGISNTIIYEDSGELNNVLSTKSGGSRRRGVRKSSRKLSYKRSYTRSY
jgi:hypothetical protein